MDSMANIPILLKDLQEKDWHITAFPFNYNNHQYIVLFEDISNLSIADKGYLVFLTFIDRLNGTHTLQTRANSHKFEIKAKEFREYFGIQYAENLGYIFMQFYTFFNSFVPQEYVQELDDETKNAVVNRLSLNDNENINNLCCYAVKRNGIHNGVQCHRTPFNSDKTKLLRNRLFKMFGNDNTISFCYREDNPLSDAEICANFSKNQT